MELFDDASLGPCLSAFKSSKSKRPVVHERKSDDTAASYDLSRFQPSVHAVAAALGKAVQARP